MWEFNFVNLPVEAFPIYVPFSNWQEAANYEEFTNQPQKI